MRKDKVECWWLDWSEGDPTSWGRFLAPDERSRADTLRHSDSRIAHMAARALGRCLLSAWCPDRPPQGWRFRIDDRGKPEVADILGSGRLRLNLSHSGHVVAAALAWDRDVGIDVEWLDRRPPDCLALARRFFAPAEYDQVAAASAQDRLPLFLRIWTLKEAYVKAIGKGLAQHLDAFWFTSDTPPALIFSDGRKAAEWTMVTRPLGDRHVAALAVHGDAAPDIVWRPITDLAEG